MTDRFILAGCRTQPMGSYLKAMGVFRILAEQADPDIRAAWSDYGFVVESHLGRDGILEFFEAQYHPSLLFNPWGGRSGFYDGNSEKAAREALAAIAASDDPRLSHARDAIGLVQALLADLGITDKPDDDEAKIELMQACRARLPDHLLDWLDAVVVLTETGRRFPPLLGTGGNEGSGSYTSGFAQQLLAAMDAAAGPGRLRASLLGHNGTGLFGKQSPGHFDPGAVGGPNGSLGFEGSVATNPWDYILTLEGTLCFAAAVTRKLGSSTGGASAFPFTVKPASIGYGSSSRADEADARGEVWFPVWSRPASYREISMLLSEGRVDVGRRRARNGLDFARAVASLGVDRGIDGFERYGYLQRNGLSIMAVPLGYWAVADREPVTLLDDIDGWLDGFRRKAMSDRAPASVARALRRIESAAMAVCRQSRPQVWQDLIIALGQADRAMARSGRRDSDAPYRPAGRLTKKWLRHADDGSPEFRLAASLASIQAVFKNGRVILPAMRGHFLPLDRTSVKPMFTADRTSYDLEWIDGDLVGSLLATLLRRLQVGAKENLNEAVIAPAAFATVADVEAFIGGRVDDRRIASLAVGLGGLSDWGRLDAAELRGDTATLPADHAILRTILYSRSIPEVMPNPRELPPALVRAFSAGRLDAAIGNAVRLLRAAGAPPIVRGGFVRKPEALRRAAAALLFALHPSDTYRTARNILRIESNTDMHHSPAS
jgi:CRISPR-associated protein Csx17